MSNFLSGLMGSASEFFAQKEKVPVSQEAQAQVNYQMTSYLAATQPAPQPPGKIEQQVFTLQAWQGEKRNFFHYQLGSLVREGWIVKSIIGDPNDRSICTVIMERRS